MDDFSFERTGESLCSIVDLWEIVSDTLGITPKQAADFVERKFKAMELVLWINAEYSGLWKVCEGSRGDGGRRDLGYLMDAWNSAESAGWSPAALQQWKFLKLTPKGFSRIQVEADRIKNIKNDDDSVNFPPIAKNVQKSEIEIDPTDLPIELDAANMAFRAVSNGHGDQSATARNRLIDYLEKHYPDFKHEQVQRIATVANPDKTTGRKKNGKE